LARRQSSTTAAILGALANTISSLGKKTPTPTVASIQDGPSPRFPEGRRKKVRYGPYRIPPISVSLSCADRSLIFAKLHVKEQNIESQMLQQTGMANTIKIGARKPCQKECMILDINANLEYFDGTTVPNTPGGVSERSLLEQLRFN
jgi:hypothetical protein